jgi:hypothetical protein
VNDPDFVRIGTKERDEALQVLGEHFAEGRLPIAEYDERVTKAIEAETRADLRPLFQDLPHPHPSYFAPPPAPMPPAPVTAMRYELDYPLDRNKVLAGALQIVLPFGIGRFYLGYTKVALAQLLLAPLFIGVVWSIIDGILLLINGSNEAHHRRLRG